MTTIDLITILGNISRSLEPLQKFITGGAYLLGLIFCFIAFEKLKKIGDRRAQSSSHEKMYPALMYLFVGAILIYLPSAIKTMSNTAFGVGNVISYVTYNPTDLYSSMGFLIRTAGVIWFIRGCVLIAHASEPGTQHGPKGLAFIIAGVLAVNFDNSVAGVNYVVDSVVNWTLRVKESQGF